MKYFHFNVGLIRYTVFHSCPLKAFRQLKSRFPFASIILVGVQS